MKAKTDHFAQVQREYEQLAKEIEFLQRSTQECLSNSQNALATLKQEYVFQAIYIHLNLSILSYLS